MNAIVYLFQVSACMGIFYLFYALLLSRFTFFTINRWYLISSLAISFIIPLLTITVHQQEAYPQVVQQIVYVNSLQNLPQTQLIVASALPEEQITWMALIKMLYLVAVTTLALRLILIVVKFFTRIRNRKRTEIDGVSIIQGDEKLSNGSFFNYIFLNNGELSADELEQIIAHEMLHVKLYHSVDRILVKIAQVFLWFNPFVYLYARAIEQNQEFEVDRAESNSTDRNKYAELLFHLSVARQGTLYHSFSMVPLKKRITMLFTKPTNRMKKIIYLLVVPVVLISCLAFAKIKKGDIKDFDLAKAGREVLSAIKSGQENVIEQLNQPVQLPTVNSSDLKITRSSIQPAVDDSTVNYSALLGAGSTPFKKDAVVTIDDKVYPTSILYEMSGKNIAEVSTNAKTGEIKLTTQNGDGQIYYLTAHEKANIRKERAIPRTGLYMRIPLTTDDGRRYDFVSIGDKFNIKSKAWRMAPDDKVGFLIDGVVYDEEGFKKLSPEVISSLSSYGFPGYKPDTLYYNKYKVLFEINSNEYAQQHPSHNYDWVNDIIKSQNKIAIKTNQKSTDTLEYNAQAFKVTTNAALIEVVKQLPNVTAGNEAIFVGGKKLSNILINYAPYNGSVLSGLRSLPASIISYIQIISTGAKNEAPATINVITKPK